VSARPPRRDDPGTDPHLLTGVYAADALTEIERAAFERHLAGCPSCAQEVRELRATTARLAAATTEEPPPALRASVLAAIGEVRQLPPGPAGPTGRGAHRPWVVKVVGAAAAVLLLVVGGLGIINRTLDRRAHDAEILAAQVASVLSAPDARTVPATGGRGQLTVVVSPSRGRAVVAASGLPAPGAGRTYQLWLVPGSGAPRPAGLLEPGAGGSATRLIDGDPRTAAAVALTNEPAGGSPAPTTRPTHTASLAGA
jgi:anti-sigma-K factor RskA